MTTEEMVSEWIDLNRAVKEQLGDLEHLEYAIQVALERDEATEYPHPTHSVKLENGRPTWDYSKLKGVFEYVHPVELEASRAWTPEHKETITVKEKWNVTRLKPYSKRGKDIRDVIEGAKIPGRAQLRIKPKE